MMRVPRTHLAWKGLASLNSTQLRRACGFQQRAFSEIASNSFVRVALGGQQSARRWFSTVVDTSNGNNGGDLNLPVDEVYDVIPQSPSKYLIDEETYKKMYWRSLHDADAFWGEQALEHLDWITPFHTVKSGTVEAADMKWFDGGQLNASYNCVDRWAESHPDRVAILFEGDEPSKVEKITYKDLKSRVCKMANLLTQLGVEKGDRVAVYLTNSLELVVTMLACARIGAVHNVVFAGFSAHSLRERIVNSSCSVLVTADFGLRGGRRVDLKKTADAAIEGLDDLVKHVVMFHRDPDNKTLGHPREVCACATLPKMADECPPTPVSSEDPLFILYTSGSTGQPKGVIHTTGGYLLHCAMSYKYCLDYREGDVHGCMADIGWMVGHSLIVYGPLASGTTTFLFEGTPLYPDPGRYWQMVERHGLTSVFTSPTAVRAVMKHGDQWVSDHDLSSLRVLASAGEPINPEAWRWLYNVVGKNKTTVVDTYWQTETGGIVLCPFPGATKLKPGSACGPFFGIDPVLVDVHTGKEATANGVDGILCFRDHWPGMFRSLWGDHKRMLELYCKPHPGLFLTGDGCVRDKDGYLWITGRVDDAIKVSGHRIGSAEVEHALAVHPLVAESAVVGFPDPIKGQGIFCYVTLKSHDPSLDLDKLALELKAHVRAEIGPIATPDWVVLTPALPKTRSGKIMRRILRKLASVAASAHVDASGESHIELSAFGDTSTLENPEAVKQLIDMTKHFVTEAIAKRQKK